MQGHMFQHSKHEQLIVFGQQATVTQAFASTCWWYDCDDNLSAAGVLDGAAAEHLHHGVNQSLNQSIHPSINQSMNECTFLVFRTHQGVQQTMTRRTTYTKHEMVILCMPCAHRLNSFQSGHMHDALCTHPGSVSDLYNPSVLPGSNQYILVDLYLRCDLLRMLTQGSRSASSAVGISL